MLGPEPLPDVADEPVDDAELSIPLLLPPIVADEPLVADAEAGSDEVAVVTAVVPAVEPDDVSEVEDWSVEVAAKPMTAAVDNINIHKTQSTGARHRHFHDSDFLQK